MRGYVLAGYPQTQEEADLLLLEEPHDLIYSVICKIMIIILYYTILYYVSDVSDVYYGGAT